MIELLKDTLIFSFPEIHEQAVLRINFQRTLRIPDDDKEYPLPPGLGNFPLRHTDDHAERVPGTWLQRGGVMLPMYQSEALWLNFTSPFDYMFAVKIATGKVNAITGEGWNPELIREPQDYLVVPDQPWLDGYSVEKGIIRQFVAMPLGAGYSVEEQITGAAVHGGLQIMVYPIKAEVYARKRKRRKGPQVMYNLSMPSPDMGLAPGGKMRQEIYDDKYEFNDWNQEQSSRCFVNITNSLVWRMITSENPPTVPFTAEEYTRRGLPWFDYYAADQTALEGAPALADLTSVARLGEEKGEVPLPENTSVTPAKIIELRKALLPDQVRESDF
jgi:hypothetical protein